MVSKMFRFAAALVLAAGVAGAASAQTHKVRYAYGSVSFTYIPFYLAEDMGFLKREGVDFEVVQVAGSGPAAAATISGNLNFFVGIPFSAARAIAKGQKLATFAMIMTEYGTNIVVSKEIAEKHKLTAQTPIEKRLDVLKGIKIASWTPGSAPDLLVRYIAAKKGWKPERDMTLLPIGGSGPMLAALENKRVDSFSLSSPTADQAVQRFGAFMLYNGGAGEWPTLKGAPYMALIGNTDWLEKDKDAAAAVYRALWRGMIFLREKPAEAKAAIRKRLSSFDEAAFEAAYSTNVLGFPKSPEITPAMPEMIREFVETTDGAKLAVPAAKLVNTEIGTMVKKTFDPGRR